MTTMVNSETWELIEGRDSSSFKETSDYIWHRIGPKNHLIFNRLGLSLYLHRIGKIFIELSLAIRLKLWLSVMDIQRKRIFHGHTIGTCFLDACYCELGVIHYVYQGAL